MKCPKCGNDKTRVTDSRKAEGTVARERHCPTCGAYFWTAERVIDTQQGKLLRSIAINGGSSK